MPPPPSELQHRTSLRRKAQAQAILSEDASLEEHGEFILYYYDHSLHFSRDGARPYLSTTKEGFQVQDGDESTMVNCQSTHENPPSDHATEDAVRFAGICRALRSLPQAIQPHDILSDGNSKYSSADDEVSDADVVHLNDSTLVFIPLELSGDIIAIVQVPRAQKKFNHSQRHIGFGANPLAITKSMQQKHAVFSLMFGGGIHRRLIQTKHLEDSNDWVIEDIDGTPMNNHDTLNIKTEIIQTTKTSNSSDAKSLECSSTEQRIRCKPIWNLKRLSTSTDNRISSNSSRGHGKNNTDSSVDYRYGGVEELFKLRREHRKLMSELRYKRDELGSMNVTDRWGSNSDTAYLLDEVVNEAQSNDWICRHNHCTRRIDSLLKMLPLTKLRADLIKFYDQWLLEMQDINEIIQGGVGSCVVNMVPSPIRQGEIHRILLDPDRGQHPPFLPNPIVYHAAKEFMKAMINEEVAKLLYRHDIQLSGMSFFYQNRHILSECISNGSKGGQEEVKFLAETSTMIVEYFRSHRKNCKDDNIHYDSIPEKMTEKHDNEALFVRWMSNLSTRTDDTTVNSTAQRDSPPDDTKFDVDGSYVEHPSPSQADGLINSLFVHHINKHVWLQRVHLTHTLGVEATNDGEETGTYVAMYEHPEFTFLLFFYCSRSEGVWLQPHNTADDNSSTETNGKVELDNGATHIIIDVLCFLADKLATFCSAYSSSNIDINSKSAVQSLVGMDMICIDNDKNSFILMSQHDLSSNEFKRMTHTSSKVDDNNSPFKSIQKMFGNSPKLKERNTSCPSLLPSTYSNVLDCRHKLAAYLPLEIIHALDDLFNEMRCSTSQHGNDVSIIDFAASHSNDDDGENNCMKPTTRKSREICSYLPQGWVWGRSFGNVELYMILDTSKFATINDVQKAVARVQEELIHHIP